RLAFCKSTARQRRLPRRDERFGKLTGRIDMNLQIFKALWGHSGDLDAAIVACEENEFDGLEGRAPATATARNEFRIKLSARGLAYIAEICTAGSYVPKREAPASEHLESLRRQAEVSLECNPLFLTIIGGCDA